MVKMTNNLNSDVYFKKLLLLTLSSLLFWLIFYNIIVLFIVLSSFTGSFLSENILSHITSAFSISFFIGSPIFMFGLPCQLAWLLLMAPQHPVNSKKNQQSAFIASLFSGITFYIFFTIGDFHYLSYAIIKGNLWVSAIIILFSMICSTIGGYFILKIYQQVNRLF